MGNACASVASETGRTDGKASLLLAFNGAVLALGAAAVLLLLVVRPRLRCHDRASFPYWARLDDDETIAGMQGGTRAARIRAMSGIAGGKFRQLRYAVDLSLAALALLLAAACGLI
ncbi:Pycsar system effector family protein [Streptomyces hygroscopicus]|uniref:Pycsar system effector family protein n=1 Tax=Streptomyces hygroscopicus TaxID=1912 RepID=UPI0033E90B5B